jgi:hypothetical protein
MRTLRTRNAKRLRFNDEKSEGSEALGLRPPARRAWRALTELKKLKRCGSRRTDFSR